LRERGEKKGGLFLLYAQRRKAEGIPMAVGPAVRLLTTSGPVSWIKSYTLIEFFSNTLPLFALEDFRRWRGGPFSRDSSSV